MHIGPEPTTDRFIAVVHGEDGNVIKGNSVTGVSELPFAGLSVFGGSFLNKFEAAVVSSPRLRSMTIVDTPGVLSGEKQRISRGYDFSKVSRWFAERSDLILLVFDAYKLDISDEFKSVIEELRNHEDKVRCVLNKADGLDTESLMRVYGALLWSMGKIFKGSEVTRVYVGSFSDEPIKKEELKPLFEKDYSTLLRDLNDLPKACSMRKVNEMVKRIRLLIVVRFTCFYIIANYFLYKLIKNINFCYFMYYIKIISSGTITHKCISTHITFCNVTCHIMWFLFITYSYINIYFLCSMFVSSDGYDPCYRTFGDWNDVNSFLSIL